MWPRTELSAQKNIKKTIFFKCLNQWKICRYFVQYQNETPQIWCLRWSRWLSYQNPNWKFFIRSFMVGGGGKCHCQVQVSNDSLPTPLNSHGQFADLAKTIPPPFFLKLELLVHNLHFRSWKCLRRCVNKNCCGHHNMVYHFGTRYRDHNGLRWLNFCAIQFIFFRRKHPQHSNILHVYQMSTTFLPTYL